MKYNTTIFIPINGRLNYTIRVLEYLRLLNCKFNILIADGCKKKYFSQNFLSKNFPNLKIDYQKFSYDKHFYNFVSKVKKSIELTTCNYIFILPNDDFVNLKFLKDGETFLSKNKSYSCVGGEVKSFSVKNYFFYEDNSAGTLKIHGSYYKDKNKSIENKDLYGRMHSYSNLIPWELLHKKKILLEAFSIAKKIKTKNFHELAWILNTLPLFYGKKKKFSQSNLYRQLNTTNSAGRDMTYSDVDYAKIKKYLAKKVRKFSNQKNENKKIITFFNKELNKQKKRFTQIEKKNLLNKTYKFIKLFLIFRPKIKQKLYDILKTANSAKLLLR